MTRNYSNIAESTTLTGSISNSATTLAVASVTGYPSAPFTIIVDPGLASEELVEVGGISGLNFTGCTRGVDGTPATSHSVGATVVHGTSARDFREPNDHMADTTSVHGISDTTALVTLTGSQTLTNKTLTSPTVNGGTLTSVTFGSGVTMTSPTINTPSITNPTITSGGSWAGSPTINTPTITTPTIANFTNAQHNHTSAATGGSITTGGSLFTVFQERTTSQSIGAGVYENIAGGSLTFTAPSSWPTGATKLVLNMAVDQIEYNGSPDGLRRLYSKFIIDTFNHFPNVTGAPMYVVADTLLGQLWSFSYSWVAPLPSTSASHTIQAQVSLSENGSIARSQMWAYAI